MDGKEAGVDTELEKQIRSDLSYLRASWTKKEFLDDDVLRRDSVILRRFLVDGGAGLLPGYRRRLGRKGPIEVRAIDLKPALEGLDRQQIDFASAGGAEHNGTVVHSAFVCRAVLTPEQIKARYERGETYRNMSITRYLDSSCLVVRGVSVSRRNIVQYIANRRGGVHFDPTRDRLAPQGEDQFKALDQAMVEWSLADKNTVYFELLSIGQGLVASPQVAEFLD